MPEEIEQRGNDRPEKNEPLKRHRRFLTRRNALFTGAGLALLIILLLSFTIVTYRYGVFDPYIKEQFTAKMADIGITFGADVFRVTVSPLELELQNATFNNKVTGEKLFTIRD